MGQFIQELRGMMSKNLDFHKIIVLREI